MSTARIHPAIRIGHVHLKVADLERALGFDRDVLGFEVTQRIGRQAAFLSARGDDEAPTSRDFALTGWPAASRARQTPSDSAHHHLGRITLECAGGRRRRG